MTTGLEKNVPSLLPSLSDAEFTADGKFGARHNIVVLSVKAAATMTSAKMHTSTVAAN